MQPFLYMYQQHLPLDIMEKDFVYFVRSTTGEVPMPNTVEDAEEILPIYFSFGYSNCNTLVMIELLLGQVQKPFFYLVVI